MLLPTIFWQFIDCSNRMNDFKSLCNIAHVATVPRTKSPRLQYRTHGNGAADEIASVANQLRFIFPPLRRRVSEID
jgi:hypothetical protein